MKEMIEDPETATLKSGVVIHPLEAGPNGFRKGVKPMVASAVKVHCHGIDCGADEAMLMS